ncbi:MAG: M56 family metallopeptidase [Faecousia sp.]
MSNLFSTVLNMSMTGSIVILLIMLARLILKRSPKIFSYALWSVVLFRLLCPVAFTAPVSALNALAPEVQEASELTSIMYYLPAELQKESNFAFVPADNQSGNQIEQPEPVSHSELDIMKVASCIWSVGVAAMLLYSAVQYVRLRMKLIGAMVYRGNVYLADYLDTPFVMGILSPKIYLPSNVPTKERKYIIAHERYHIRRCDHIIKLLAYCALCIHWFNPLVWAAFILAGKDMEMSCDEAVIKRFGPQIRADYSASLLRLATHKKIIAGMPLAFGEGDTKGRVMNMAKWKKPKLWVSIVCFVLCATILVACAVNPATDDTDHSENITQQPEQLPLVNSGELEPVVDGSYIITDTELVQYGTLKMLLTPGFGAREQDGAIVLTKDSVDVGGITCWSHPGYEPDDMIEWIRALGLPELQENFGVPIGYMAGNSAYGDLEIEIFQGDNPEALNEEHVFFIDGNLVYDVWYDENLISDGIAERFLKTVAINSDPVVEVDLAEQEAFAKCRAVMEAVQNGSYQIISRQMNAGNEGPKGYERIYCRNNNDWLSVTNVLTEGENFADGMDYSVTKSALYVDGRRFSYTGTEWVEIANYENSLIPWLADFTWDENEVAYMDTLTDEEGECVMLRVDEKYVDSDEYDPHYFVYFNFDPDGNFVDAYLQVNLFQENEFTITESIISLDPETVNAEIQQEYQRAVG